MSRFLPSSRAGTGLALGVFCYTLWGLFPLYFHALSAYSPIEIVANRVVWSLVLMAIIISIGRTWPGTIALFRQRRIVGPLAVAAVLLAINWGVYVWAVTIGQVLQASLGYFFNPLVSVLLGVVVLHERLRPVQWVAVAISAVAVLVLSIGYGHVPWIGLVLAVSFGLYGLIKKRVGIGSVESLTIETAVIAPVALAVMAAFLVRGTSAVEQHGTIGVIALILLGPVTAIPLLAFGGAATRIPLSTLGLLQYLTPIVQFILGYAVFHEVMTPARWVGFVLVWIALAVFSVDSIRHLRRQRSMAASTTEGDALDELAVVEPD